MAGKSPKSSSFPAEDGEYGVLKVSAVGDGEYRAIENKALLDEKDFNADFEVKPGMILVTRANAILSGIGRACLVENTPPRLMLSDKTLQLVPNPDIVERDFLLHGLRREPYRSHVEKSANGTDAKNISQETLRRAPFWIPDLSEQKRIVAELDRQSAILRAALENAARLVVTRSLLVNTVTQ